MQALSGQQDITLTIAGMQALLPSLPSGEQADFQRAGAVLSERARLLQSLRRQQRAQQLMRRWRTLHIILACLAVVCIGLHLGFIAVPAVFSRLHLH
jgi:hypothetical protein